MTDEASIARDALEDLLDRERNALMAGDIEGLSRMFDEKERLLKALDGTPENDLQAIKAKADRNQELLNSALDGIRTVSRRLETLREVRETLNTYDQGGKRRAIQGLSRSRIERRA
jgi:hypothetical protein